MRLMFKLTFKCFATSFSERIGTKIELFAKKLFATETLKTSNIIGNFRRFLLSERTQVLGK